MVIQLVVFYEKGVPIERGSGNRNAFLWVINNNAPKVLEGQDALEAESCRYIRVRSHGRIFRYHERRLDHEIGSNRVGVQALEGCFPIVRFDSFLFQNATFWFDDGNC